MKSIILLLTAACCFNLSAQNIQLDPTFGPSGNPVNLGVVNAGVSTNVFSHYSQIRKLSIDQSGGIVTFGSILDPNGYENFGVSKYNSDGSLDNTFGSNGFVSYSWYHSDPGTHYLGDRIYSGGIQSTGKILAVGLTEENISGYGNGIIYREACVLRLNTDGTVDSTFGINGKIKGNYNGHIASTYHDILLLPDDSFYSLLEEYDTSGYYTGSLAKHKANGDLDSTFGVNGVSSDGDVFTVWGIAVQNDSKILISGYGYYDSSQAVIKRFNVDGSIDTTFGDNGVVKQNYGVYNYGEERYSQLIVQPDGKIIATGWAGNLKDTTVNEFSTDLIVSRYNIDGTLDQTYGNNGLIRQDILSTDPSEGRINRTYAGGVLLSDGSLLVNSYEKSNFTYTGENDRIGFFKYTANGVLDTNFGNMGHYNAVILSDTNDYLYLRMDDMKLLPNNKVVLGGSFNTTYGVTTTYPYVSNILLQVDLNSTIDVKELSYSNDLRVYPNPSSDFINIEFEESQEIKTLNILSVDGKLMESLINFSNSNKMRIDVSSLSKGAYIIQSRDNNNRVYSNNFIKK